VVQKTLVLALQRALDQLSVEIGRPLTIFDEFLILVAHTTHGAEIDPVRRESILTRSAVSAVRQRAPQLHLDRASGPFRCDFSSALQMEPRVVVPLRRAGTLLGSLWVSDPGGALTDADCQRLDGAGERLVEVLYQSQGSRSPWREKELRQGKLLRQVLKKTGSEQDRAWETLSAAIGKQYSDRLTIMALLARSGTAFPSLLSKVVTRQVGQPLLALVRERFAIIGLCSSGATPDGAEWSMTERLRNAHNGIHVTLTDQLLIGIAPTLPWGANAAAAREQAEDALTATLLLPEFAPVAKWEDLGLLRLALKLNRDGINLTAQFPELDALLELDSASLLDTFEAYLDNGADVQRTANQLFLHRATVYYRLEKVASIIGCSLHDGQVRALFHVGIKLYKLNTTSLPPDLPSGYG